MADIDRAVRRTFSTATSGGYKTVGQYATRAGCQRTHRTHGTDGHAAYAALARETGISHQAVNLRAGIRVRGAVHVQNVNAYHSRLRGWLSIFHGVATRYLPNYLGWRWILDARRILSAEILLKATLGEFPHLTVT